MEYLYHRVPPDMTGNILYPLNVLRDTHPQIYTEYVKKYEKRQSLLILRIPPLDCLWNDVIHLTAVEPHALQQALAQADTQLSTKAWFKIPTALIEGDKSIAFIYPRGADGVLKNKAQDKEYEPFNLARMDIYRTVPPETIEYYKKKNAEGLNPLLFHLVPHILYKGLIDTAGLEIVQL